MEKHNEGGDHFITYLNDKKRNMWKHLARLDIETLLKRIRLYYFHRIPTNGHEY